jgi:DNA topoisomerase IB
VNLYIQSIMGDAFSAKDFRTWAGGLAAAAFLQEADAAESKAQAERVVRECVKAVSQRLGNTPAVCRACYIHPAVIEAYRDGTLAKPRAGTDPEPASAARVRSWVKLRFSSGTLLPPLRAISRRRSASMAAKPRRAGRRGVSVLGWGMGGASPFFMGL